jgi:hypothetical protein
MRKTELGGLGRVTNFDFQYIPAMGLTTELGKAEEPGGAAAPAGGVERRNLRALLAAAATVGIVAWLGLRAASGLLQRILG